MFQFDESDSFGEPVSVKWPGLAREYRARIKNPMDLDTMGKHVSSLPCEYALSCFCAEGLSIRRLVVQIDASKYKFFQPDAFVGDFQLIG